MAINKDSNGYTFGFAIGMVVIVGSILAGIAMATKPFKVKNDEVKKKMDIVKALMDTQEEKDAISRKNAAEEFNKYVNLDEAMVIDVNGNVKEGVVAFDVDIRKENRDKTLSEEDKNYPLYVASIDGKTAYEHRKSLGSELAKENKIDADIVVPVPDSGNAAALGFAQHLGKNFEHGLIRNHYVGRTFIEPSQQIRSLGVKLKLNANRTTIKDKKIILIDDSLVRGTTSLKIVKMLYESGAKEVHVRIACPEIKFPDFYGVDMPTKKELLANNRTNQDMCEYINAKTLKFLSLDGLYKALGLGKRNNEYPQLSDHYFTGDYPIKPGNFLGESKITQLSLLSSKSNN